MSDTNAEKLKAVPNIILREPPVNPEPIAPDHERVKSQLDKLPKPTGFRLLVVPFKAAAISKGGIHFAEKTLRDEHLAGIVGYVVSVGLDAYADPDKFPEGPWCKAKDYIIYGRYAGSRIMMQGEDNNNLELRILNDDDVIATIDNPEDYVGIA